MDKRRLPTLADVARRAGVSRSLVSLAIRGEGNVKPETRERIFQAAQELDYRPNLAARVLASAQSAYVGTLVGDITNPLQAEIAKWVSVIAAERGFSALVSLDAGTDEKAESAIEALIAHRVSGVILIGTPYEKPAIARVAARLPSIYIGRLLKAVEVDSVTTDHIKGAVLAVEHLFGVGCRSIVHVGGGASPGAQRMQQGYRETMERHGIGGLVEVIDAGYSVDAGAQAGRLIFARRPLPDAIFTCNDLTAVGVLNEAAKHGVAVPEQVRVVGYDDVTLAGTETLALTTVHQPARDLAEAGVDALDRRLSEPNAKIAKTLVPPQLVLRRSSLRAPD